MKFIPLLFSTPMVQAEQAGRKTMTRRTIKPQPSSTGVAAFNDGEHPQMKCPYGKPGDILWVRESHYAFGEWKKNGTTKTGKQKWKFERAKGFENIRFMDNKPFAVESPKFRGLGWYKRPSLFMPKAACRTFLEITNIRVERLNDINEVDSISEGVLSLDKNWVINNFPSYHQEYENWVSGKYFGKPPIGPSPKQKFTVLWQSINGPDSWDPNPWVWVISFKRITKPENFC